jgi:hypothetical protein
MLFLMEGLGSLSHLISLSIPEPAMVAALL